MTKTNRNYFHLFLLLLVVAVFIWSIIKPKEGYGIWCLEVIPAIIGLSIVLFLYNKFRFTTLSYVIMSVLAIAMFIGGHYSYNQEPFFEWLKDTFDLKRNHYDRLGHFLKGFSFVIVREILIRKTPLQKGGWINGLSISVVVAIGALFEIGEWLSVVFFQHGKMATNYLGAQGDHWDAQWDMFLNTIGSLCALLLFAKLHNRLLKRDGVLKGRKTAH